MRIDILTVLPEMIEGFFDCSIMARAKKKGLADIVIHNIRDYTTDKHLPLRRLRWHGDEDRAYRQPYHQTQK